MSSNSVTIYHNPRCSKSRETLKLLEQQGITPLIVEYLKTPPDKKTLLSLLKMLELSSVRELMRTKENEYKTLGLDNRELSEEQLIEALLSHPKLMERPVVVANGKAKIGRPPEQVLAIL